VLPVSPTVPGDVRATFVRILAYMGALAILAIAAASLFEPPAAVSAVEPAPRPDWINVERPHPAFELVMPELAAQNFDYAILRRPADGARKDVLSFGEAAGNGPYVMVEIYRAGSHSERFIDAPSEVAARITRFTVSDDVKPSGTLDSKFGDVALVDFAIARPTHGPTPGPIRSRARRCLGFARAFDEPAMQIAGWYCSAGEELVDRAALLCTLDRLTMLSAGGDTKLAGLFAHAEIKRTFCGQRSPILAATPERNVAVAIPRSVKLRGRLPQQRGMPRKTSMDAL
jgi:hypothetical protein